MMKINEIFFSIQGEGKWIGKPNIFIRVTGCNLRCNYCDTTYAYVNGNEMNLSEIIANISKYPCKNVCITGGEPLLQNEIQDLIKQLFKKGYSLILETNGSLPINEIVGNDQLVISMDIKCPSSGMNDKMIYENLYLLTKNDQVKFIIGNKDDYIFSKNIVNKHKTKAKIFFQPIWNFNPKKISSWILEDGLDVCLGIQLHKIIWGNSRGR